MSDQDRNPPYKISIQHQASKGYMSKGKYQSEDYWLIQYQILQIYIIRMVWQTVRRITKEILGVKGSREWECLPKNKIIHVPKYVLNALVAFSN